MAGADTKLIVDFDINTRGASKALKEYVSAFDRDYKRITEITKKSHRKMLGPLKDFWRQKEAAARAEQQAIRSQMANETKLISLKEKLTKAERKLAEAQAAGDIKKQANIQRGIARTTEQIEALKDAAAEMQDQLAEIRDAASQDIEIAFSKDTQELGEAIGEGFSSFVSKDAAGVGGAIAKVIGKGLQKTLRGTGSLIARGGEAMQKKAAQMQASGGGGMAKALGGVGKLVGSLGGLVNTFARFAPLLSVVSTSVMALIKLLVDAEANFKDFNKTVIASSGSLGYLDANVGHAKMAAAELGYSLNKMYEQAVDYSMNLAMAINRETYQEITSTLGAEGISLHRLNKEIANSAALGQSSVNDYGKVVQMTVAYSRTMGVSLQEVSQLQGQLMSNMGMSLERVNITFAEMAAGAAKSGIASQQFFNIIRGVSADLALYNYRLGDAVKMLTKLGKVMSAKSAEKFMQTISGAVRGMGRVQRLQVGLLAGKDKLAEIVDKDIKSHAQGLAQQISDKTGESVDKIMADFKTKGSAAFKTRISAGVAGGKISKEAQGTMMEQASTLGIKQTMSKKGTYGMAQAAAEGGVAAQADLIQAALGRFAGGKSLKDAVGDIGVEQMAENLGISREQLNQMVMFNEAMDEQRNSLKAAVQANLAGKATPAQKEQIEKLKKMGVDVTDAGKASDKIAKLGNQDLLDTMDAGDKKALENATKIRDFAAETAQFQSTITDKLEVIIDFLLHKLYKIMTGIWDTVLDIADKFTIGGGKRTWQRVQASVGESGTDEMKTLLAESKDADDFRNKIFQSKSAKEQEQVMLSRAKENEAYRKQKTELETKLNETSDPQEQDKVKSELAKLQAKEAVAANKFNAIWQNIEANLMVDKEGAGGKAKAAAGMAGIDGSKGAKIEAAMKEGKTLQEAFNAAGLSEDEQARTLEKIRLTLSTQQLAYATGQASKDASFDPKAVQTAQFAALKSAGLEKMADEAVSGHSLSVHDHHAVPLLGGILDAVGGQAGSSTGGAGDINQMAGSLGLNDAQVKQMAEAQVKQTPEAQAKGTQGDKKKPPMLEALDTLNETASAMLETSLATTQGVDDLWDALRIKGIKLAKVHLENDIARVIEESTLKSIQTGLFEYYLYKDKSQDELRKLAAEGGFSSIGGIGKSLTEKFWAGGSSGGGGGASGGGSGDGTTSPGAPAAGAGAGGAPAAPAAAAADHKLDITTNVVLTMKEDLKRMIEVVSQETVVKELAAKRTG